MIANNYFNENEDLIRQFEKIVDWAEVIEAYEDGFADAKKYKSSGDEMLASAPSSIQEAIEYYKTVLESTGDVCGTIVSQKAQEMDKIGLKYDKGNVIFPQPMVECMNAVREAGLIPYGITRHYGGLGIPYMAQVFIMELTSRADAAFSIAMGCGNLADTIERYGSKELIDKWVPKMATGEYTGAMALTEPNYGSDLQSVQTKAVKDEQGNWKITGTKRFITHGCGFTGVPAVILTLARTGTPTSGARGLSFFLVESKDVHIASIEKKMGLHCSPTCEVVYDNTPGILIGEEGQGLIKAAMGMMNGARLTIAAQSMGIATASYYEGKKYASERIQFGKPIEKIPAVRKMLDRMERELAGMRGLLYEAARFVDQYLWRQERMRLAGTPDKEVRKDEHIRKFEKLATLFTPLSKYYISEMCNKIASDALQIHGGSGYTEDYDVARLYRDARITNIYEGTTQLQVVAAIGGVVSGLASAGFLRAYIDEELAKFAATAELKKVQAAMESAYTLYRDIENADDKDTLAFEMVESATRFIIGMIFERSANKLQGEEKEERMQLAQDFHLESLALIEAYKVKMQHALRDKTALAQNA